MPGYRSRSGWWRRTRGIGCWNAPGRAKAGAEGLVAVRDAGFTEIDPGTITVVADAGGL